MKKYPFIFAMMIFAVLAITDGSAEIFRYRYSNGDAYRINSVVEESIYIDRIFAYSSDITNRITVAVSDVQAASGQKSASAKYDCTFMTSERTSNRSFAWGREYPSIFRRTEFGIMDIADTYFMPVVRNVPTFPDRDIKKGESWKGTGEESHDLRDYYGLEKPFKVPFNVVYTFEGPIVKDGKTYSLILAEYTLFYDTPQNVKPKATETNATGDYPVTTMGFSKQRIYWDAELGMVAYYDEEFRQLRILASGTTYEFKGTAYAMVTETKLMDRTKMVKEMNDEISRLGIKDVSASSNAEGVTISLENIQFEADSPILLPIEKEKIIKVAALLERYPDKELLISGHTALAGTAESRQKLSEERAEAVARFLVEMGVRNDYNVYTRGFGAEKPIAPNDTEANKSRNRRVEITILEK